MTKRKGKIPPLVFIETIELYFPDIDEEESWNEEKPEILVFGQIMSHQCFGFLSVLVIPIIVGTMFITFWNVYLVEESVGGNCEANFDCFPKDGDDYLQQEPVSSCSMFEFNGNVTYECYRLVFRYAKGLGAAGGILAFTAVFSKLYFSLLVTIYHNMNGSNLRCYRLILYGKVCAGGAITFLLFIGLSVGVPEIRETVFQSITSQVQFAMYAFSLLVIIVSGVVVVFGIEIKNAQPLKHKSGILHMRNASVSYVKCIVSDVVVVFGSEIKNNVICTSVTYYIIHIHMQ